METAWDFYLVVDSFLISFYRLTGNALVDYCIGTLLVAFLAVLLGEITSSICFFANRAGIDEVTNELVRANNLSISALKSGNKAGYTACNKLANEMFGKQFFLMLAMSASSLWPAFFALAWLQTRFSDISFSLPFTLPIFGDTVGYSFTFIVCYIPVRIVFGKLKYLLPYFCRIKKITDQYGAREKEIIPFPGLTKRREIVRGGSVSS